MAWVKVDDGFYQHPKRWLLGSRLDAIGLWLVSMCYASHQLTDGFVPTEVIDSQRPRPDRRDALAPLIEHGFMEPLENGLYICGYLDHQPSRADVLARREQRATAGRKGGLKSRPGRSET